MQRYSTNFLSWEKVEDVVQKSIEFYETYQPSHLVKPDFSPRSIVAVGDTHTALDVTLYVINNYVGKADLTVFLGDYVDRGKTGVENLYLVMKSMIENNGKVIAIRGNHESPLVNRDYGFYMEVKEKYGEDKYPLFVELFGKMPYVAVSEGIFFVHGGIPRGEVTLEAIGKLPKDDVMPDNQVALELLWNDPRDMIDGFIPSPRGDNIFYFGTDVTDQFLERNGLNMIVRGHEVADGFRIDMDGKVITVFSSRYHRMRAGILKIINQVIEKEWL